MQIKDGNISQVRFNIATGLSSIHLLYVDAVIQYLNTKKSHIVFMLWGSHAQKKGSKIDKSVSKSHCI